MGVQQALEVKIWILTAGLGSMLALLAFFLKRLLDSFEKKTEKIGDQLQEHNAHIICLLQTMSYHKEKLDWIEKKLDREH